MPSDLVKYPSLHGSELKGNHVASNNHLQGAAKGMLPMVAIQLAWLPPKCSSAACDKQEEVANL